MEPGSYRAYCLDEAVIFFGMRLEFMLEEATNTKPTKEERAATAQQQKVFDKVFGPRKDPGSGFADPALMFK